LCDFYREEFVRHIEHLSASDLISADNREPLDQAYQRLLSDLDRICGRADFPALAEILLERFDCLTRLSERSSRSCH
jgi:hypothetical protein